MKLETLNSLVDELGLLYKQDLGPFPYDDIAALAKIIKKRLSGFTADLAYYYATLAGWCTWKRKILDWPEDKVRSTRDFLVHGFYEQYPQYLPLQAKITADDTPALYADMILHEKMRHTLLTLLEGLSRQRTEQPLQAVA